MFLAMCVGDFSGRHWICWQTFWCVVGFEICPVINSESSLCQPQSVQRLSIYCHVFRLKLQGWGITSPRVYRYRWWDCSQSLSFRWPSSMIEHTRSSLFRWSHDCSAANLSGALPQPEFLRCPMARDAPVAAEGGGMLKLFQINRRQLACITQHMLNFLPDTLIVSTESRNSGCQKVLGF